MTALSAPRAYTFERDGITKFPASSASCKQGSLIAFRPSTGYAVKWDATADDEFVGIATKNHDSASEIEVRTMPSVVRGYFGSSDGPHGGVSVTGASAVTDNGKPIYASDDNVLTLTPNTADPVGEVVKWISGTLCWVRLIPSGTNRTSAGATDVSLGDNLAAAYVVKEGSTSYLTFVTTDSAESLAVGKRLTTTDGVASGTVKVVGGRAYSATSAADNLLASAGASGHVVHAQTYSIPASTLKAGSVMRIKYKIDVTNDSGTDTLETKLYLGGTTSDLNGAVLITTTAFDPSAATDYVIGEFEFVALAAPGAAASCVGCGSWVTSDNGSEVRGAANLVATNFATNGALIVKVSSKWSSTTASTNARLTILNVDIT